MDEPTLAIHSSGEAVERLQQRLNAVGGLRVPVTGTFDTVTFNAVVALQRENGLDPDGVVTPPVWRLLRPSEDTGFDRGFEDVYESTAEALSRMELPDFRQFEQQHVRLAFNRAFELLTLRPSWLSRLRQRVHELSGGEVFLEDIGREELSADVKGAAAHLRLVGGGRSRRLLLTPTDAPLEFLD